MRLVVRGDRVVVSPTIILEPGFVTIEGGRIVEASGTAPEITKDTQELSASLVTPGFVDIHTHGIGGTSEVAEFWLNPEYTLTRVVKYGTTALLATMVLPRRGLNESAAPMLLNPFQGICIDDFCACGLCFSTNVNVNVPRVAKKLNATVGKQMPNSAVLEGIHAEGPVVATLGGLPPGESDMSMADFAELLKVLGPGLKVMTIAPSLDAKDGYQKIQLLLQQGVKPALGHDKECTAEDILGALRHSSVGEPFHITHGFNVQNFHHRNMGLANFALAPKFPSVPEYKDLQGREPTVEIIGDCAHVDALVLQSVVAARRESGPLSIPLLSLPLTPSLSPSSIPSQVGCVLSPMGSQSQSTGWSYRTLGALHGS
jgi:N-acetylglucosamine-6-phosphate deacetylase